MTNKHLDYLKRSYYGIFDNNVGELKINGVLVYVKEPLPEHIDMKGCLQFILSRMPKTVMGGIDRIMIGHFSFLQGRHVDAVYNDGIIYVTNQHDDNKDFMTDVVHEIGHSFEEEHRDFLYADKEIEHEFLSKRKKLYEILSANNLVRYPISQAHFEETKYNRDFDEYLYKTLGYQRLRNFTNGLFISPYGSTCLREYYGNAFEHFFTNDIFVVKKYSPSVYKKLVEFLEM